MDGLIRHSGIVRAIAAGQAQIAVATTGCSACGHGGGCGIGKLAGKRKETLLTLPAAGLVVGQQVALTLDERQLTRAALLGYLLPAVLLIVGALVGEGVGAKLGAGDTAPAGALLGLLAGLGLTRLRRPLTPRLTQEPPHV